MLQKCYAKNNSPEMIARVVRILEEGGVVILPTDTMYGFACHALKERAVERICRLKGIDPKKNNLSIICYDLGHISEYAKVDNAIFKLMKHYLPGPFTFILNGTTRLPKIFRNRKEVGIRMPSSSFVRELASALGAPLMVSSLPLEEEDEMEYAMEPELMDEKWGDRIDLVIDGGIGGVEGSTVVDCTGSEPVLLRQGVGQFEE